MPPTIHPIATVTICGHHARAVCTWCGAFAYDGPADSPVVRQFSAHTCGSGGARLIALDDDGFILRRSQVPDGSPYCWER